MTNNPTIDGVSRVSLQQVLEAYDYANNHPHKYLRGTSNWCAAVAYKLNEFQRNVDAPPAVERQEADSNSWRLNPKIRCAQCVGHGTYLDGEQCGTCSGSGLKSGAALQSTIAQLQARIGDLESLHGEVYQVLGALDASAVVLDKVSAAANGESIPNTALLPYFSKGIQLPDKRQAMRSGDYICGWNAAIDATTALNTPKPAEWHDVAGDDEGLVS